MAKAALVAAGLAGLILGAVSVETLRAQQQGEMKWTLLTRHDIAGAPGKEAVLGIAELPAGATAGRHYHHGEEFDYVLDGTLVVMVDGQPPQELKPGAAFHIDAQKIHDDRAAGDAPVKILEMLLVDKDKPLVEPAQ
jgi:quercetin dioxygenase-like cupin family protein